jgi:hypothetical protein
MKSYITATLYGIVMMFVANQAQAVVMPLETRLGGLAYYDPNLDITWAANANINGSAFWDVQVAWAESLTIGGVSGWRLASADVNGDGMVVDCSGGGVIGCADNEMGYLFWEEGITASNPGPFSNVRTTPGVFYWSGTERAPVSRTSTATPGLFTRAMSAYQCPQLSGFSVPAYWVWLE